MKKSTKWWLAVGVVLAGLFFAGAIAVMWLTDETVEQDRGIPRNPADSIIQNQPADVDRVSIEWPGGSLSESGDLIGRMLHALRW